MHVRLAMAIRAGVCGGVVLAAVPLGAQEQMPPHAAHPVAAASADPTGAGELPKAVREPIALMTRALGPFTRPMSSRVPEARALFDQGFQMMFAFARTDGRCSVCSRPLRDRDGPTPPWTPSW